MKDVKGHGSNAHNGGIAQIGKVSLHPKVLPTITKNPGGFSVQPASGKMPTSGYMVSIPGHAHIGGWTDKETGKTYLDVSHNIKNKDAAVSAGQKHNQIAIWDVKHGKEIRTGGTGE